MPDQMRNQLGAYLDGELGPRAEHEMQAHLETCTDCQAELEDLRRLSQLLKEGTQPQFTPVHTFKAQLMLQLPPQAEAAQPHAKGRMWAWLAPVTALAGWIFMQVTLGISWLVTLANRAGLLDGSVNLAAGRPQPMTWLTILQGVLNGGLDQTGQTAFNLLNDASLFTHNLIIPLLWQIGAALVYWGALALVWHYTIKPLWKPSTDESTSLHIG
jgi:predicted anti-sigma-YlaC factor YlaD